MALTFKEILDRIRIIDRDVTELNRLKSRLPADRPYSSSLQISFDKQINELLNERVGLMELEVLDPPAWILGVPTTGISLETPVPLKGLFPSGDLSKENRTIKT
ncbi:hypothetical protein LEP1GSC170_2742 [Leptospira interrogans serovar Bataviae str. HAI135]|nr:hypothetical protein LEP1GSC170_2742 [Leptospira interrogans serovar Bataviae str. HAI135]